MNELIWIVCGIAIGLTIMNVLQLRANCVSENRRWEARERAWKLKVMAEVARTGPNNDYAAAQLLEQCSRIVEEAEDYSGPLPL